jgi:membrane-bound serine protease (ClpP class)
MSPVVFTDPNVAFVLLVLGAIGIYWEMHAPGMIVPGILGVLLVCAGAYGLYQDAPSWYGLTLLALAALLLGIELKYYTHMISGLAGTLLLAFGALVLVQGPHRITPAVAFAVSIAFGLITIFLGSLAMKARKLRHLTGTETLVGETGVSRTAINPEGTVFVHGEYWKARSADAIQAGEPVRVDRVQDLVLFVKKAG